MATKQERQITHEREMRARLGEWLDAARKLPNDDACHLWFAGSVSALHGVVKHGRGHLDDTALMAVARETHMALRSRDHSDDLAAKTRERLSA